MTRIWKGLRSIDQTPANGKVRPDARMVAMATEPTAGTVTGSSAELAAVGSADAAGTVGSTDFASSIDFASSTDFASSADFASLTDLANSAFDGRPFDATRDPLAVGVDAGPEVGPDGTDIDAPARRPYQPDLAMIGGWSGQLGAPRRVIGERGWARALRRFARTAVWAMPSAAACFALAGMWGSPGSADPTSGSESPGTWLLVVLLGLFLSLIGAIALTALFAATTGRRWALVSLVTMLAGTLLLSPVLGLVAVARPAVSRLESAKQIGAAVSANFEGRFFDGTLGRWLGVGGFTLLAVGWLALGCAALASGLLNRVDGFLVYGAVAIAVVAAYLSWQFLLVVAAMILLAAGLGISWTAARLTPDGRVPDDL